MESGESNLMGVQVHPLTSEFTERFGRKVLRGVVVATIQSYGPAARAGLRVGQVIVAVDGQAMASVADYERATREITPGKVVSLRVIDPELGETIVNFRTATS